MSVRNEVGQHLQDPWWVYVNIRELKNAIQVEWQILSFSLVLRRKDIFQLVEHTSHAHSFIMDIECLVLYLTEIKDVTDQEKEELRWDPNRL